MSKRPIKISVRLSQTEAARLNTLASECSSKKEPLIRNLIMGVEIKPRPTEEQLRLVREISGIANNINQITRLANTVKSVSPAQVEELQRELETIQGASAPGIEQPVPWWEEWLPWKVAWRMLAQESKRDTKSEGQYWCMGKGDSCQNPTSGPLDLYCDSCDPDGDNREG